MPKFSTTVWIEPDPDGVHCGQTDCILFNSARVLCRIRGVGREEISLLTDIENLEYKRLCCQDCLDAEQVYKDNQAEKETK